MTYEEAHKFLEIKQREMTIERHIYNEQAIEINGLAIEALEKQIPKKPKKKEENQYSAFYDCPCCGGYLVSEIDGELCGGQEYKYCYRCGQALDWSDTE